MSLYAAIVNTFGNMLANPRNQAQDMRVVLETLIAEIRNTPQAQIEHNCVQYLQQRGRYTGEIHQNDVHEFCVAVAENKYRAMAQQHQQPVPQQSYVFNRSAPQQQQQQPTVNPFSGNASQSVNCDDFFGSSSPSPQPQQMNYRQSGERFTQSGGGDGWPYQTPAQPVDNRVDLGAGPKRVVEHVEPERERKVTMTFTTSDYNEPELDGGVFEFQSGRQYVGVDNARRETVTAISIDCIMPNVCSDAKSAAKLALQNRFFEPKDTQKVMNINVTSVSDVVNVPFDNVKGYLLPAMKSDFMRSARRIFTRSQAGNVIVSRYTRMMTHLLNANVFVPGFVRIDDPAEAVEFHEEGSEVFRAFRERYGNHETYSRSYMQFAETIALQQACSDEQYLDMECKTDLQVMIRNSGSICFNDDGVDSNFIPYLINDIKEPEEGVEGYEELRAGYDLHEKIRSKFSEYTFGLERSNVLVLSHALPGMENAEPGMWRLTPGDMKMRNVWFIHPDNDAFVQVFLDTARQAQMNSARTQVYCPIDIGYGRTEYKMFDLGHAYGIGYYLF